MEKLLYSDTGGNYFLLDYSPSHSEMVIRRVKVTEYNIDLFFKNVQRINLSPKLTGINIFKIERPAYMPVKNTWDNKYIFKITDPTGITSYIEALSLLSFKIISDR